MRQDAIKEAIKDLNKESKEVVKGPQKAPSHDSIKLLFRSMSLMIKAGIPIARSLEMMVEQTSDPALKEALEHVFTRVSEGHPLSRAMRQRPLCFSAFACAMTRVGEDSGQLDMIWDYLADYIEKLSDLRMQVKSALTYPVVIFVIASLMLVTIPPLMVDGILQLLLSSNVELPWITKVVILFSEVVQSTPFWIIVVTLGVGGALFLKYGSIPLRVKMLFYQAILRVPVLKDLNKAYESAQLFWSLGLQLEAGLTLLESLETGSRMSPNLVVRAELRKFVRDLKKGEIFSDSLKNSFFFPTIVVHMIRAGEETGTLADMCVRTAQLYQDELEHQIEVMVSLLEPIVMLVMGVIVGFFIIATMLPMVQVLQNL